MVSGQWSVVGGRWSVGNEGKCGETTSYQNLLVCSVIGHKTHYRCSDSADRAKFGRHQMVKNSKLWVMAIPLFLILVAVELVHHYLFSKAYESSLLGCVNSSPELTQLCIESVGNAGNAFHYATTTHFLTYFAMFGIFVIFSSRLSSLEKKFENQPARRSD